MHREKPAKANLDWKPNARKCRDQESDLGLLGANRGKKPSTNLLPNMCMAKIVLCRQHGFEIITIKLTNGLSEDESEGRC